MTISFLTDALIDEETLKTGMYSEYNPQSFAVNQGSSCGSLDYMVLDA